MFWKRTRSLWRLRLIPVAIAAAILGPWIVLASLTTRTLTCEHLAGGPRCTVTEDGPLADDPVRYEGVLGADQRVGTSKQQTYGIALIDRRGTSTEVIRGVEEGEARRMAAFLAERPVSGHLAEQPSSIAIIRPRQLGLVVLGCGLVAIAIGIVVVMRRSNVGRKISPTRRYTRHLKWALLAIFGALIVAVIVAGCGQPAAVFEGDPALPGMTTRSSPRCTSQRRLPPATRPMQISQRTRSTI